MKWNYPNTKNTIESSHNYNNITTLYHPIGGRRRSERIGAYRTPSALTPTSWPLPPPDPTGIQGRLNSPDHAPGCYTYKTTTVGSSSDLLGVRYRLDRHARNIGHAHSDSGLSQDQPVTRHSVSTKQTKHLRDETYSNEGCRV